MKGARFDERAMRCAQRLRVGLEPAPATLSLIESVGEPRLKLDVNWDPETIPAFLALPACEAHGRSLPVDPYLLEPLEHYLRTFGVEVGANAADVLERLRAEHDARDRRRAPLARARRAGARGRGRARRRAAPVPARRRRLRAEGAADVPRRRAGARQDRPGARRARGRRRLPGGGDLPGEPEAQLAARDRALAAGALDHGGVSGTGATPKLADITILNYDIVHAHRARLSLARPKALVLDESHYVKNPRAKRTKAVRRLADGMPEGALRLALTGTPVMNHPDELIAQLRVLGRLEEFGSGARFSRRFQGVGAEERIHWHLRRSCFVRRVKADVLPQLPRKRQVVVPVALENEREYRLAEQDVIAWLREQPLDLSELDRRVAAALRAERLAQLNALKRLAARGKLGPALAWIDDFLASDEPLVVFCGHREVQDLVLERFPDAAHLLGRDSAQAREDAVQRVPGGPAARS